MAINIKRTSQSFQGLDLNERNVQELFEYCFSSKEENTQRNYIIFRSASDMKKILYLFSLI